MATAEIICDMIQGKKNNGAGIFLLKECKLEAFIFCEGHPYHAS